MQYKKHQLTVFLIGESKKTDIFDTEQGENTVTYKKVSSFWTHVRVFITKTSVYQTFLSKY